MQVGAQFEISSCGYEVVHVGDQDLRAAQLKGGNSRFFEFEDLMQLMRDERLVVTYTPPQAPDLLKQGMRAGLTDQQSAAVNRKLSYVRAVVKACQNPCSQAQIRNVLPGIAAELNDPNPPCTSGVAKWVTLWLKGGRADASLMPRPRRSRAKTFPDQLQTIIDDSIRNVYMTLQRNSVRAVHADVVASVTRHNRRSEEALPIPSAESIRRIIHRVDLYQRDRARYGASYAKRHHRAAGCGFFATEPLELAMADGQHVDVILVDGAGDDIGRPYLTVIIDVCTRCVLAAYISLAPFCGATLLKAMSIATVADGERPRGVMSKLVVDNGADYRHAGFGRFCARFDIAIEPAPPYSPNAKAIVERFFRTLNDGLIHRLPGTTFSNPTDRGDYDSQRYARMTLDDLRKHVDVWIHERYHVTLHRRLGRSPIDAWKEATDT